MHILCWLIALLIPRKIPGRICVLTAFLISSHYMTTCLPPSLLQMLYILTTKKGGLDYLLRALVDTEARETFGEVRLKITPGPRRGGGEK